MTNEQLDRITKMNAEVEALGGRITSFGELPPDIEEQFLRRTLERPEYIEIERQSRPEGLNETAGAKRRERGR